VKGIGYGCDGSKGALAWTLTRGKSATRPETIPIIMAIVVKAPTTNFFVFDHGMVALSWRIFWVCNFGERLRPCDFGIDLTIPWLLI
jgi:hypothetical protein